MQGTRLMVKLAIEYLLCYSTAFFLGFGAGIGMCVVMWRRNNVKDNEVHRG